MKLIGVSISLDQNKAIRHQTIPPKKNVPERKPYISSVSEISAQTGNKPPIKMSFDVFRNNLLVKRLLVLAICVPQ